MENIFQKTRIEDLCLKVTSGGTPSRSNPEYYEGEIPWVKTGELNGWYIDDTAEKITEEALKKSSAKIYPIGTVLMAMYGDGRTIGSTAITRIFSASNQACCAMIPDPNKCDSLYLHYSLVVHRDTIVKLALGGAQRNLNQATIKNFEITAPDLKKQSEIASLISNYDYLIANNNRRIAILEEMAQSLYREWFVKFRYPGHENQKLIESPLGLIPEGWEVKLIQDFGSVITGKTPSTTNPAYYSQKDIPFLKTPDMHGSIFATDISDYLSIDGANSQKNKFIPKNSICVSCIGAKAGVVAVTPTTVQTNQQINSIVLFDLKHREYMYLFAVSLHQKIHAIGSSGATMTNVSKGKFETIEIINPPNKLMEEFHGYTKNMFDGILNLQLRNANLRAQRDMLLPKLISGEILL